MECSFKRPGTVNGCNAERSGTPRNVRVGTKKCIGTYSEKRSRSRFKTDRITAFKIILRKLINLQKIKLISFFSQIESKDIFGLEQE
jgi:hypothetical protein